MSETKPCIACAEDIKSAAVLCRFCGTSQQASSSSPDSPIVDVAALKKKASGFFEDLGRKLDAAQSSESEKSESAKLGAPEASSSSTPETNSLEKDKPSEFKTLKEELTELRQKASEVSKTIGKKLNESEAQNGSVSASKQKDSSTKPVVQAGKSDYAGIPKPKNSKPMFIVLGVVLVFMLISIFNGDRPRSGDLPDPGQQGGSGRWESKCTTVIVPRSDMTAYEAVRRGLPSSIRETQCTDVWVED
jgi:hypothetical protein